MRFSRIRLGPDGQFPCCPGRFDHGPVTHLTVVWYTCVGRKGILPERNLMAMTPEQRKAAAAKAVATRQARKAAAAADAIGKIKQRAGFSAYACPQCRNTVYVKSAKADVYHRCPSFGLKWVDYILISE